MSRQPSWPVAGLGWGAIARLGAVQAAIGSIVVLATSTLNRIMVVELALPAVFPGLLVALHYAVQMSRTRVGHGSDTTGKLTSWIIGGMMVLALGGVSAASAVGLMTAERGAGIAAAIVAYVVIGLGAGACGTSLLVLLAKGVAPARRPAAATVTWLMMFVGFVITTVVVGLLLDPYSGSRLIAVTAGVAVVDVLITVGAMWNLEGQVASGLDAARSRRAPFRAALAQVWNEPTARRFTLFVFISMLAYSGQELILEPFVGRSFGMTPGQSARIAALQHGGALLGMLSVAVLGSLPRRWRIRSLRDWTVGGCIASAATLAALAVSTLLPLAWPLRTNVFVLGLANGVFAVAAIGSMMSLVGAGGPERQGLRMGLWGAAQAIAFACGGAVSAGCVDIATQLMGAATGAYACVFALQALLFLVASTLAARVGTVAVPLIQAQNLTCQPTSMQP